CRFPATSLARRTDRLHPSDRAAAPRIPQPAAAGHGATRRKFRATLNWTKSHYFSRICASGERACGITILPPSVFHHRPKTEHLSSMATLSVPSISSEGNLTRYLLEIRKFPMLEPEQEYMLAKRWKEHEDPQAAHKLVTSHLRLVAKIAMGYRGYGLPLSELISEGNVGMMQAVKRFDPDRGFRLATYAIWWITAAIQGV